MRALPMAIVIATLLGFAACGSDNTAVMPDVTGKQLDLAKSAIKDAGSDEEVIVDGGGLFGVVNDSGWEVCDQSPAAGEAASEAPKLTVDRSCEDTKPTATPTQAPAAQSNQTTDDQTLTKRNSDELRALLTVSDYCDKSVETFAAKNEGKTIEFGGSISDWANHGDADTRYDILIAPGNRGPNSTIGPALKYEDVGIYDLQLTGDSIPEYVGEGDRFRFIAEVVEYNPDQCLLYLEPVKTLVQ